MSLNSAEIGLVLDELRPAGSFIQNIRQINYTQIIFDLYGKNGPVALLVSLRPGAMRLHATERKYPSMKTPPRFVKYLRAHIKGGKINNAEQIGRERIVCFDIGKGDSVRRLYIRLWGGAANILITDEKRVILDAFSRRPSRKEVPGESFSPELSVRENSRNYSPRDIPGEGSFNSRLDNFYGRMEEAEDLANLRDKAEKYLNEKIFRLTNRLKILENKKEESRFSGQYKKYGDMIMSSLHLLKKGDAWLTAEDYDSPGTEIRISLDPKLSPRENGEKYYSRSSGIRKNLSLIEEEIGYTAARIEKTKKDLKTVSAAGDRELLNSFIPKTGITGKKGEKIPGLQFISGDTGRKIG